MADARTHPSRDTGRRWQDKAAVGMVDFGEAVDRVIARLKKTRVLSPKERAMVATHEAGHAVAAEFLPGADRVAKVSIVARGIAALGYTQQLPAEDRYLVTRSELLARLGVLLAGRTAEELTFSDVSTGAQNDLQRATDLVRHMVAQYGMSEKIGLMTFDGGGRPAFLPGLSPPREHSEEMARLIDAEASRLLADAHVKVHFSRRGGRFLSGSRTACWRRWWSGTSCGICWPARSWTGRRPRPSANSR